jgi:hypothetical protein
METCCSDPANREPQPIDPAVRDRTRLTTGATPGLTVCRACGRKHYTLTVDPTRLGVVGQAMGREHGDHGER